VACEAVADGSERAEVNIEQVTTCKRGQRECPAVRRRGGDRHGASREGARACFPGIREYSMLGRQIRVIASTPHSNELEDIRALIQSAQADRHRKQWA